MPSAADKQSLLNCLRSYGQEQLLAFWDELDDAQRGRLAAQIASVDFDLIAALFRGKVDQPDWQELSRRAEPPPALRLADRERGAAA